MLKPQPLGKKKHKRKANLHIRTKETFQQLEAWVLLSNDFLGFSFCFIYSKLSTEAASNLETPTGTDKYAPKKSLPDLAKDAEKGQLTKVCFFFF